jgi:hypothetical protein
MRGPRSRRGRKPSILTAAARAHGLRRSLKSLVTEVQRLERRLRMLDSYYRSQHLALKSRAGRPAGPGGLRGRGPNVRDAAFKILSRLRRPAPISDLARKVIKLKRGRPGANFVQNLGAALQRDRRFKRAGRGLYGVRR